MPPLLIGFVAGVVLFALRAPLGVELFQLPATAAGTAYGYRAAALAAVALGIAASGRALRPPVPLVRLLAGAGLGFVYRGLFWDRDALELAALVGVLAALCIGAELVAARRRREQHARPRLGGAVASALIVLVVLLASEPQRPGAAVAFGFLAIGAMALLGRGSPRASEELEAMEVERAHPRSGIVSGLALAGAGVALASEGIARHLRLMQGGLAQDDAVTGGVLICFAALGAAAFAQSVRSGALARVGPGPWLAAAALATFASLHSLATLAGARGLDLFLRAVDRRLPFVEVGLADHGTLAYDLALALPVLALPAVLLGAGLRALRRPPELAAVLLGAAVGCALVPAFLGFDLELADGAAPALASSAASADLVPLGAKLAALGASIAIALGIGVKTASGRIALLATLAFAAAAFLLPAPAVPVLSPWELRPAQPTLVLDSPEGLLTVEPTGGGIDAATLDRRPLTPPVGDATADRLQLEAAWEVLPEEVRRARDVRVLLIGQLSPGRALALTELGATRIDRSASWHRAMPLLEAELFGEQALPQGAVLAPAEARERLAAGEYDLLIVPPVPGDAPATRNLGWPLSASAEGAAERDTVAVIWLDTRSPIAHVELGARVLPVTFELVELAVAIVYGRAQRTPAIERASAALAAGRPAPPPDPIDRLRLRDEERRRDDRAALARRLAGAGQSGAQAPLTEGLARFFAGQERSSGFESAAERVEVPAEALALFREAALAADVPDPFLRSVVEAAASILRGKRRVEDIQSFLAPIAERHPGWPTIELAIAHADLELLDPEAAATRLRRLAAAAPSGAELWLMLGEADAQSGRARAAAESFWRALELEPQHRGIRRRLAIQLALAGDPGAEEMIRGLLLEEPDDEALRAYLGPGPYPELPSGYRPPLAPAGPHAH